MKKILLNDSFIVFLIILNAIILFADSFDSVELALPWLRYVDLVINVLFITEMFLKVREQSWRVYIEDGWNKMDFGINLLLIPSLVLFFLHEPNLLFLTVLRLIRISKFFRFFKFVPHIDKIIKGIGRALKSSVFIVFAFLLYLFIISILSCFFFKGVSPEHFGDPLLSLYSTFKIFTIEGWYELPELIATSHGALAAFFIKIYFIFLVLSGGVFGMGLINAIFVDEMVADNNDELNQKIDQLQEQIKEISELLKKDK